MTLRDDVTPDAVTALRLAADNMPLAWPGGPWEASADWLRRRADAFEQAIREAGAGVYLLKHGCCGCAQHPIEPMGSEAWMEHIDRAHSSTGVSTTS